MKIYTIIGGTNGVGKSSFIGAVAPGDNSFGYIIDADKITAETGGNNIKGGRIAIERINKCLEMGVNFTQETTLSGVKTLHTIKAAKKLDYEIRLFYIGIESSEDSIARIHNRVLKGGHDIPVKDVKRRFKKRFDDLIKILPYCNIAEFYDNTNGFVKCGEFMNGELELVGKKSPEWIEKFKKYLN